MSRVQLALNVANMEEAIDFYSKLFATEPAKVRPGYANFAIADPPLKLVLIEDATKAPGSLNHLGVEVGEHRRGRRRPGPAGRRRASTTEVEDDVTCCYAVQDKVWADGPGGAAWEFYTVLADAEMPAGVARRDEAGPPAARGAATDGRDRQPSCC